MSTQNANEDGVRKFEESQKIYTEDIAYVNKVVEELKKSSDRSRAVLLGAELDRYLNPHGLFRPFSKGLKNSGTHLRRLMLPEMDCNLFTGG
jgi:hypothetical protein